MLRCHLIVCLCVTLFSNDLCNSAAEPCQVEISIKVCGDRSSELEVSKRGEMVNFAFHILLTQQVQRLNFRKSVVFQTDRSSAEHSTKHVLTCSRCFVFRFLFRPSEKKMFVCMISFCNASVGIRDCSCSRSLSFKFIR